MGKRHLILLKFHHFYNYFSKLKDFQFSVSNFQLFAILFFPLGFKIKSDGQRVKWPLYSYKL